MEPEPSTTIEAIDTLVDLAHQRAGSHVAEGLFVPPHGEVVTSLVNDVTHEDTADPEITSLAQKARPQFFAAPSGQATSRTLAAVDAGVADLGELASGGTIFAIRGAAVFYLPAQPVPLVYRYNTGPLLIDGDSIYPIFHFLGWRLGVEDLFITPIEEPPYYRSRQAMADTPNRIQDRCRNFVERMIQEEAIGVLAQAGGGTLLIDGALAGGTFDTPDSYLEEMLRSCRRHDINVVAISKKTRITVGGIPIGSLFTHTPDFAGYAPLRGLIEDERQALLAQGVSARTVRAVSVADEIFAVRLSFGPPGLTFRTDVHPVLGWTGAEVLDQLASDCPLVGGYPRPLIEAHHHSSFLALDVQHLLADVVVRTGVHPQEAPTMSVIFGPFGNSFK